MTLENIVQEVQRHGQEEADKIRKEAGKQVLAILNKATREIEAMKEDAKITASQEAKRLGTGQISAANLEARKLVLTTRAEMLRRVKEEVMARLEKLTIIEKERIMKKLLAKARKVVPEGTAYVRAEDLDILRQNMGSYRIGPSVLISGGIIVDSADRKLRLDLSFETLFEETWERNFSEISHMLFREAGE